MPEKLVFGDERWEMSWLWETLNYFPLVFIFCTTCKGYYHHLQQDLQSSRNKPFFARLWGSFCILIEAERLTVTVNGTILWSGAMDGIKKEKRSRARAEHSSISLCPCPSHLEILHPKTVSWNKPFCLKDSSLKYCVRATRKVTID